MGPYPNGPLIAGCDRAIKYPRFRGPFSGLVPCIEVPTSDETALPKEEDGESWLELLRDGLGASVLLAEKHGFFRMGIVKGGGPLMNLVWLNLIKISE